jgi:hypothetical protein
VRNTALLVSLLCAAACSSAPATQAFLEIDAEGDARRATTVRLRVLGGPADDLVVQRVLDLETNGSWPLEVSIEPMGGDASRRWQAQAWAMDGGAELGAGEAEGGFSSGKVVTHALVLRPDTDQGPIPEVDDPKMDGGPEAGLPSTGGAGGTGATGGSGGIGGTSGGGAGGQGGGVGGVGGLEGQDASLSTDASAIMDGGASCSPVVGSGACPPDCSRCESGTCFFDCNYPYACGLASLACPPGWACTVICSSAAGACSSPLNVHCSDGPCRLECASGSCLGAKLTCGAGACEAICESGSSKPAVTCNDACSCTEC